MSDLSPWEQQGRTILDVTSLTPQIARMMPECYGGYPVALLLCQGIGGSTEWTGGVKLMSRRAIW